MNFASWDLAKTALAALSSDKASGHPIQSDDWNRLVAGVNALIAKVEADKQELKAAVDALDTAVNGTGGVKERLTTLEQEVTPLLDNYLITLACSKGQYLIGESCEMTVHVTDLRGQPIVGRPWVDLYTSWGQLSAKAGFESRAGVGNDSLSVRVNAQGTAQVLLQAQASPDFSDMEYRQMAIMLEENVPETGMSMAQSIQQSSNPTDHRAKAAFKVASKHYEKAGGSSFQKYADGMVLQARDIGVWRGRGEWHEYASTVMAFAKPDADPLTADGARGTASIQVVFRDWVSSWGGGYIEVDEDDDTTWGPVFTRPGRSMEGIHHYVEEALKGRGILGRQRHLGSLQKALDKVDPQGDPWVLDAREQTQQALGAQKAAEGGARGAEGAPVMGALMGQGARTQAAATQAKAATTTAQEAKGMADKVNVLEGRMQSAERVGVQIQGSLQMINENVRSINALDEASLKGGVAKISTEIAALKARMG